MSYTIIPQAIDINNIVDDDTIKIVSNKLKVNETRTAEVVLIYNEVF